MSREKISGPGKPSISLSAFYSLEDGSSLRREKSDCTNQCGRVCSTYFNSLASETSGQIPFLIESRTV